jgi:hypothetical protein
MTIDLNLRGKTTKCLQESLGDCLNEPGSGKINQVGRSVIMKEKLVIRLH